MKINIRWDPKIEVLNVEVEDIKEEKMKIINQYNEKLQAVTFEAEDVNDPAWNKIIKIMHENGIKVMFGDGNNMCFEWPEEWEEK